MDLTVSLVFLGLTLYTSSFPMYSEYYPLHLNITAFVALYVLDSSLYHRTVPYLKQYMAIAISLRQEVDGSGKYILFTSAERFEFKLYLYSGTVEMISYNFKSNFFPF